MPITHAFVSGISDGADANLVRPSNWNADHVRVYAITSYSTTGSIAAGDETVLLTAGAGGITRTLPTAVGVDGQEYILKRVDAGAGNVTIDTTSAQTIDGATSYILSNQWQYVTVQSDGANWVIVGNN